MKIDLTKVSGDKKNVWWFDAATGRLSYIGEFDNKPTTFSQQNPHHGIPNDGVLIAVDASKDYLTKEQTEISDHTLAGKARNLNE
jgi:hypothetical protein